MKTLHVGVDPVDEVGGLCVHSWVAGLGAPVSPRDNSGKLVAAHEWTARVSLAGVLAALVKTGTDHGVSDVVLSVGVTAVVVRHDRDVDIWRTRARLPPSEVVPHPETVQMVHSAYSSMLEGRPIVPTLDPMLIEPSRVSMQMSLLMFQLS